ncbi:hypothetical protein ONZ45_g18415 [Pleurotus djamor]|nr:hypothetical protein ONZ45_g18415 [Pleurotus djamor]
MQHQQQQQQARLAAAQQQALQQQQQNGRSTPQPAIANVASPANRSVPLSRSMTPQQTPVQLPPHLAQHAQAQHIQALRQNPQYAAQLAAAAAAANGARASGTPLPANVAQQQALLQAQAQAQAQAGNSQQQQMQGQGQSVPVMAYPQMYNYQMGLMRQGMQGMAGVPASYWMARMPTMVNGMANGQAMPGMPQAANGANPQALGVGVQKAGQAGQAR